MQSIYLSEAAPRLMLATESDLQAAVDEGLLVESHYLDVKRELPAGSGRNLEHARDLAAFAVDGGTIVIGVQEDRQARRLQLVPQVLSGLRERVEQIARFTPDPPVPVRTHEIPTADDPSRGYLVVHVPASPLAPHMVDGRYLGRGDATNQRLSDSEVVRLHEQRRIGVVEALALLDREIARDPAAEGAWEGPRRQAHLFVVASPLAPRPEMLLPQLKDVNVHQLVRTGGYGPVVGGPLGGERFSPDLSAASRYSRRADGTALSTPNVLSDRTLAIEPGTYRSEDLVDVEFSEDGAIRVVMTRLSDATGADGSEQRIFDFAAVVYVRRVMAMAVHISDLTGYHGGWQLAVGVTGLKGMFPFENPRNTWGLGSSYAFEDDEYRNARVVSYTELLDTPGALTMALLGKFLRKLGTENRHADLTLDTVFEEGTGL